MNFAQFLAWGIYELFDTGLISAIRSQHALSEGASAALIGGGLALCVILPYLLGSINWAVVISHVFYHDDIRKYGSGNAGATNMLRTYGKGAAAGCFLGDGLKGVVSIVFACLLFGHPETEAYYFYLQVTACYLATFFCVMGHVFPCFSHFRGGKGIATTALAILVLNPAVFIVLFALFIALVALTRYVSLGSVVCILFYPLVVSTLDGMITHYGINTIFSFLLALLITWCHRHNLKRIMDRTEHKISFGKKKEIPTSSEPEGTGEES